ncbi:MAG: HAD-IIA family hydrolase [Solirubrobacterales bacterium]|nr:HAD-IIA family hydrolase [Solirubrobacterales bacterium]
MRLADHYAGLLIDLDGVVWRNHQFLPGAAETVRTLLTEGMPIAFVTNNPRLSPAEQAAILRDGGVEIDDGKVVTAGSTLFEFAREMFGPAPNALVVGTDSFHAQAASAGIVEVARPDRAGPDGASPATGSGTAAEVVLVSGHETFDYAELRAASMAARDGALLAATGRDPIMPMPDGLWPGTGAILAAIETASGKTAVTTGKPEPAIFEAALRAIGSPGRVAMIGDQLSSDIAGAQAAGLEGILVEAGTDPGGSGSDRETTPDHRIDDLAGLLRPA